MIPSIRTPTLKGAITMTSTPKKPEDSKDGKDGKKDGHSGHGGCGCGHSH